MRIEDILFKQLLRRVAKQTQERPVDFQDAARALETHEPIERRLDDMLVPLLALSDGGAGSASLLSRSTTASVRRTMLGSSSSMPASFIT